MGRDCWNVRGKGTGNKKRVEGGASRLRNQDIIVREMGGWAGVPWELLLV